MPRQPVPVPRVLPFQRPLPFHPLPARIPASPVTMPSHLKEAALRPEQFARVAAKLQRLLEDRPYAAGVLEHAIDRLLATEAA